MIVSSVDHGLVRDLAYVVQLSLGATFVSAGTSKLRHPARFAATVAEYRLTPRRLAPAIAGLLIGIEMLLALAFLMSWLTTWALLVAGLVLSLFFMAVAINIRRGRRIVCGCFGGTTETITARSLIRLTVLLAGVVFVVAVHSAGPSIETLATQGVSGLGYLAEVVSIVGFIFLGSSWLSNAPGVKFVLGVGPFKPDGRARNVAISRA
jgi:hypothetical protein